MTTKILLKDGQNEIYNHSGLQLIGSCGKYPNAGMSPRELLESALGLCISLSLQKVLEQDGIMEAQFPIVVDVAAVKSASENIYSTFKVTVSLPAKLENSYKKKLMATVEQVCAISNTLKSDTIIETIEI